MNYQICAHICSIQIHRWCMDLFFAFSPHRIRAINSHDAIHSNWNISITIIRTHVIHCFGISIVEWRKYVGHCVERTLSDRTLCTVSCPVGLSNSFNLNWNIWNGYFYSVWDGDCVFMALWYEETHEQQLFFHPRRIMALFAAVLDWAAV